jgi:hypothetical protein
MKSYNKVDYNMNRHGTATATYTGCILFYLNKYFWDIAYRFSSHS